MAHRNFSGDNLTSTDCRIRLQYLTFPLDFGYYICGPTMSTLILIGIIANSIFLYILFRTRPIPIVNFFTIPLCLCDFCVLIGSFFMVNLPHLLYGRMKSYGPYVQFYPFLSYFSNFAYTCCVWLVVSLSIERYFALCHPLTHRVYDARKRSTCISISCFLAAIIYNLPRYFELDAQNCYDLTTKTRVWALSEAPFRHSKAFWITYKLVLGKLLMSLGPLLILCVLSILMWKPVRASSKFVGKSSLRNKTVSGSPSKSGNGHIMNMVASQGDQSVEHELQVPVQNPLQKSESGGSETRALRGGNSSEKQRQSNALVYTLFLIVLKFTFCHILPVIIDTCETFLDDEVFHSSYMNNLVDISALLVVANSSLNFFIHIWCSRHFRKTVKGALVRKSIRLKRTGTNSGHAV